MAEKLTLKAIKREASGSGAAKRLRREGGVPAVIYGAEQDNYALQVNEREFTDLVHHSASENVLLTLQIEGAKEAEKLAMVQQVQHDPLTGKVVHVDFHAVREDEELTAQLPLELVGEPAGVKNGGMLDQQMHTIEVRCKPADLPEKVELDVSHLEIGMASHASDLSLPAGVEMQTDGEIVVASVHEVKVLPSAEELAAEAAAAAEVAGEAAEGEAPAAEGEEGAPAEGGGGES